MARFAHIDGEPVYSELKPERCPRHGGAELNERQRADRRRAAMDDYPEAYRDFRAELDESALYSQRRRRSR